MPRTFLQKTFRTEKKGFSCAEKTSPSSPPPLSSATMRPWNLDVITWSSSAAWRSWRSEGRAGNGSSGTSPGCRRSTGCRSTTGRTLSCRRPDPAPSSRGCHALCSYLAKDGEEAAGMNLRSFFLVQDELWWLASFLPGMVLSRTKPKNPPMNMWVVKSTTMTWSSSFTPAHRHSNECIQPSSTPIFFWSLASLSWGKGRVAPWTGHNEYKSLFINVCSEGRKIIKTKRTPWHLPHQTNPIYSELLLLLLPLLLGRLSG